MKKVIKAFLKDKACKEGNYYTDGITLKHSTTFEDTKGMYGSELIDAMKKNTIIPIHVSPGGEILSNDYYRVTYLRKMTSIIAVTIDGMKYGNSGILPYVGRRVSFGNEVLNRSVTPIQEELEKTIPMIPLKAFDSLEGLSVLDNAPSETLNVKELDKKGKKVFVKRHFTGAKLFKQNDKTFLFDVDRREIKHGIFNAFMTIVPGSPKTIKEAYDALMPDAARGVKHKRQGEWFFIPCEVSDETLKNVQVFKENKTGWVKGFELIAGENRPNYASEGFMGKDGIAYVKGIVTHSGREHAPLKLNGWHKVYVNKAIGSVTLRGDVD